MRSNRWSAGLTCVLASGMLLSGCADAERAGYDAEPVAQPAAQAEAARTPVTLRFKAKVGKEDFACGQVYAGQGTSGASVTPQDFRLYVQDVRLIAEDGTEVPVALDARGRYQSADVALLDFATADGQCRRADPETNLTITGTVPAGKYRGVAFVNGVPERLNHVDPATAPLPLQAAGMSWGWAMGFKFVLASAVTSDPPSDAPADPAVPAVRGIGVAQIGSTACSGSIATGITCQRPNRAEVRLADFDPAAQTIVADFGALFGGLDLKTRAECHGSGATCAPIFQALGVDAATGKPLATQRVFRVE